MNKVGSYWICSCVVLAMPKRACSTKEAALGAYPKLVFLYGCYYEDLLNALCFLTIYSILLEFAYSFDFVDVVY